MNEDGILDALRQVVDPELGINIVDLGLIYSIETSERDVRVVMTMTTPACPMNSYLTGQVRQTIADSFEEAETVSVDLVWEPQWSPAMMSAEAKHRLGWE